MRIAGKSPLCALAWLGFATCLPLSAAAQDDDGPANIRKMRTGSPQAAVTPKEQAAGAKTWPGRNTEPATPAYGVTKVFNINVTLTDAADAKDKTSLPSADFSVEVDRVVNAGRMHEQYDYTDGSKFTDGSGQTISCAGITFQNDALLKAITEAHEDVHVEQIKQLLQQVHDTGRWDSNVGPKLSPHQFTFTIKKDGLKTPEQPFTVTAGDTRKLKDNLQTVLDQLASADTTNYGPGGSVTDYPEGPARSKGCEKFWELAGKALQEAITNVDASAKAADAAAKAIDKGIGLGKAPDDVTAYLNAKGKCDPKTDELKKTAGQSVEKARQALDKLKADKKALDDANDKLRAALDAYSDKKRELLTPGGQAERAAIDKADPGRQTKRIAAYDKSEMMQKTKAGGKEQSAKPATFNVKLAPAPNGADNLRNDKLKALTAGEDAASDAGKVIDKLEPQVKKLEDDLAQAGSAAPDAPCDKPPPPPAAVTTQAPCPAPAAPHARSLTDAMEDVAEKIARSDCH